MTAQATPLANNLQEQQKGNNIILIGFMASGKTFLARVLQQTLNYALCDTDQLIEAKAGQKITTLFKQHGETYFRALENSICQELRHYQKTIIATGGGIILTPQNRLLLKRAGTVFFLKSSVEQTWQRVKNDQNRPLLQVEDRLSLIKKLHAERLPLYQECADVVLDSDRNNLTELTALILTHLSLISAK